MTIVNTYKLNSTMYKKIFLILAITIFGLHASAQEMKVMNDIQIKNIAINRVGNNMMIVMDVELNNLQLKSNKSIALTPYIESWDGTEKVFTTTLVINGRKQHIYYERNDGHLNYPNAIEVTRANKTEQTVRYDATIPYQPWMDAWRLYIDEDLCGCGKPIADNSSLLAENLPLPTTAFFAYATPEMEAVKARSVEGRAYLDFPVNKTVIYPDYRNNPKELASIMQTINIVKEDANMEITGINIHGYASPEGSYNSNARLAEGRAEALKEYVRRLNNFSNNIFTVESTPEDWSGLIAWLETCDLNEKEALLAIAQSDLAPDAKDLKIKKDYPTAYATLLANCYPALRHSDYVVNYIIRPFSVEEAAVILETKPSLLSLYEIYMVANSYPKDSQKFRETLIVAATLFPQNKEANLNAANALIEAGELETAKPFLARAAGLPQATMLEGVLLMWSGDIANARLKFAEAQKEGVAEAAENLKLIENHNN